MVFVYAKGVIVSSRQSQPQDNSLADIPPIALWVPCGQCREGSGEETDPTKFRVELRLPNKTGYIEPSDWLPADGVSCPWCSTEVNAEDVHELFLAHCQELLESWSEKSTWPNFHGDWRPKHWSGHCGHLASALAPMFGGQDIGGDYCGPMTEWTLKEFWSRYEQEEPVMHSWIRLPNGMTLDPTRWAFHDRLAGVDDEDAIVEWDEPTVRFYLAAVDDSDYRR